MKTSRGQGQVQTIRQIMNQMQSSSRRKGFRLKPWEVCATRYCAFWQIVFSISWFTEVFTPYQKTVTNWHFFSLSYGNAKRGNTS